MSRSSFATRRHKIQKGTRRKTYVGGVVRASAKPAASVGTNESRLPRPPTTPPGGNTPRGDPPTIPPPNPGKPPPGRPQFPTLAKNGKNARTPPAPIKKPVARTGRKPLPPPNPVPPPQTPKSPVPSAPPAQAPPAQAPPVAQEVPSAAAPAPPATAPIQVVKKTAKNYIRNLTNGKQEGLRDYKGEKVPYWNTDTNGNPLPEGWKRTISISNGSIYYYSIDGKSQTDIPVNPVKTNAVPAASESPAPAASASAPESAAAAAASAAAPAPESATDALSEYTKAFNDALEAEKKADQDALRAATKAMRAALEKLSHIDKVILGINTTKNFIQPLPNPWKHKISKSTGKIYYYKEGETDKPQYTMPSSTSTGGRRRTHRRRTHRRLTHR